MSSHRRFPPPGLARTTRATVLSAAAALSTAVPQAAVADPPPTADTAPDVVAAIDRLYEQAERATERYNRAAERSGTLRTELEALQGRAARDQERINRIREAVGSVAGAQYRQGGIDPTIALLLSSDPESYLERAEVVERVTAHQGSRLRELHSSRRLLERRQAAATRKLAEYESVRAEIGKSKRAVQAKLERAQRLFNAMSPEERAGYVPDSYDRASRSGRAGTGLLDFGPSAGRAALAVAAAEGVIGSPYAWGQAGPASFDCSGLVQYAYRQAGVSLPRTSQAQAHAGRHVPLNMARPGDIVTYRQDASHVGMYVGNGQVVHAPYPGAAVRHDPVGMMPVHAVTRV